MLATKSLGFAHQFCLCGDGSDINVPDSFIQNTFENWQLYSAPDLPLCALLDEYDNQLGWVIGWFIDCNAAKPSPDSIRVYIGDKGRAAIETALYHFAGRWLALVLHPAYSAVYLDPLASLSVVYTTNAKRLASTPALLNAEYQPCYSKEELIEKNLWYPFGSTAHADTRRLLANHYLDLVSMRSIRHWPTQTIPTAEWQSQIPEIALLMQKQFADFSQRYPVRIGLTAGFESRVMLATALASSADYHFWTREDKTHSAATDLQIAKKIAAKYSLNHSVINAATLPELTNAQVECLLYVTGYCIGGSPIKSAGLIDSIKQVAIAFTGIGGEIARAYYCSDLKKSVPKLTVKTMLERAHLPQKSLFNVLGEEYLASLSGLTELQRWSLFYLENRVSAFGAVHRYAYQNGIIFISPFSHRQIIETMFKLTREEQSQNAFHLELIKWQKPDLLEIPFNPVSLKSRLRRLYSRAKMRLKRFQVAKDKQ